MTRLAPEILAPRVVGAAPLAITDLIDVAVRGAKVRLSDDPAWRARMAAGEARLARGVAEGTPRYGVTTGFGSNCGTRVSRETIRGLGEDLLRFHGCGTGPALPVAAVCGAMLCRIACLGLGYSGVRIALLQRLVDFLNSGIEAMYESVAGGPLGQPLPAEDRGA